MNAHHSKSAFLHGQVRRALQSGRYLPGQRIDPGTLADEFHTSPTPVRFALYRLVGEGLLVDCARNGLYVPLPTEVVLRDLYDWMERLLAMACEIHVYATDRRERDRPALAAGDDVIKATWKLFDEIARSTGHKALHRAVKQANDRLAPVRRAKSRLIEHASAELSALARHWQAGDMRALDAALHDYHQRRKRIVPAVVELLSEQRDAS